MKIRILLLILLGMGMVTSVFSQFMCPNGVITIINELPYTIDTETNEITFHLECDPCTFDDGGSSCECQTQCDEESKEFLLNCIQNANGLAEIIQCKDLAFQQQHFCKLEL